MRHDIRRHKSHGMRLFPVRIMHAAHGIVGVVDETLDVLDARHMRDIHISHIGRTAAINRHIDFASQQIAQRQNLSFILTEVADIEDDTPFARQLQDTVMLAAEHGGVIIVITTKPVWSQLQRLGMSLALSSPTEDEMREIIHGLNQKGKTIFFSSHSISEVEKLCHRVGILVGGHLARVVDQSEWEGEHGRLEEIFVSTVAPGHQKSFA